uniref:C-type lectin domain-containing protein n=1 Tax=Romanomermis culicivorax TaxID=13658 RepID=A0A915L0D6_ROMCU
MSQSGFQMCTCGTSGGYVCQISDETVPMPPSNLKYTANRVTSASPACPSNWVLIGKLYYQTPPSVLYPSVSAAAAACASLDARATLPYFTDATQWEAFLAVISTWQVVDNRNITIGARQVQPGVYQMLDGAWLYSDWYTFGGQPSTIAGMDCVTMRDIDGYQWRSIDCNNTPVYTICQLNCTVTGQLTTS